jgi:hypothetical protein
VFERAEGAEDGRRLLATEGGDGRGSGLLDGRAAGAVS